MPCLSRIVLALSLMVPGLASPASAQEAQPWEKDENRLRQEAKALFEVALAELDPPPRSCELDKAWDSYSVPYEFAKKYPGHTIISDLAGLKIGATTAGILAPLGKHPEWFCSFSEFYQELEMRIGKDMAARRTGESPPSDNHSILRRQYSFPVFDRNFRTAILIRDVSSNGWYIGKDGRVRQPFDMVIRAFVYRKSNGRWKLIKQNALAHGHGG